MGFNYGCEKRKFDKEWERIEKEYREAGMDEGQINSMREFDWAWFCSQRVYKNHTQILPNERYEDEEGQSCLFRKFGGLSYSWDVGEVDNTRYGWLSAVENRELFQRLCKLSKTDLELLTLIFVDGYRQADIAVLWGCSRNTICKRLKRIKKDLR